MLTVTFILVNSTVDLSQGKESINILQEMFTKVSTRKTLKVDMESLCSSMEIIIRGNFRGIIFLAKESIISLKIKWLVDTGKTVRSWMRITEKVLEWREIWLWLLKELVLWRHKMISEVNPPWDILRPYHKFRAGVIVLSTGMDLAETRAQWKSKKKPAWSRLSKTEAQSGTISQTKTINSDRNFTLTWHRTSQRNLHHAM